MTTKKKSTALIACVSVLAVMALTIPFLALGMGADKTTANEQLETVAETEMNIAETSETPMGITQDGELIQGGIVYHSSAPRLITSENFTPSVAAYAVGMPVDEKPVEGAISWEKAAEIIGKFYEAEYGSLDGLAFDVYYSLAPVDGKQIYAWTGYIYYDEYPVDEKGEISVHLRHCQLTCSIDAKTGIFYNILVDGKMSTPYEDSLNALG